VVADAKAVVVPFLPPDRVTLGVVELYREQVAVVAVLAVQVRQPQVDQLLALEVLAV
jgi:hypothetical protein